MVKYDKKSALRIIINAAKEYDEKLNDKHFLIVYQDNGSTKAVCVGFRDMNKIQHIAETAGAGFFLFLETANKRK